MDPSAFLQPIQREREVRALGAAKLSASVWVSTIRHAYLGAAAIRTVTESSRRKPGRFSLFKTVRPAGSEG